MRHQGGRQINRGCDDVPGVTPQSNRRPLGDPTNPLLRRYWEGKTGKKHSAKIIRNPKRNKALTLKM